MEGINKFILLLRRYRTMLIMVPLITVVITFFVVRNIPDTYNASTQVATGILDEAQAAAISETDPEGVPPVNQKFVNLIEAIRSKSLIDQVSYQLILHDLTTGTPFKDLSVLYKKGLNDMAIRHATGVYREKYNKKEALNLRYPEQQRLADMLVWMGYDSESILQELTTSRLGMSDIIKIEFKSQDAELSAFVVNAVAREIVKDHTILAKEKQRATVEFLTAIIKAKSDTLNDRVARLGRYKLENRILDLPSQSLQVLNDLASYKRQQLEVEKNLNGLKSALANIDKLNPLERAYPEPTTATVSQDVLKTRLEIQSLIDKYHSNDFDEQYQKSIDSLQQLLTAQINNIGNKNVSNPASTTENLVQQKLGLQDQYNRAAYSLISIKNHIAGLTTKFNTLVPHEAIITDMERDIDVVTKEYQELLAEYNKASMESALPVKIRQVRLAMPGGPNPSNKILPVVLSGIISAALCLLSVFIIFLFDRRIKTPMALAVATRAPVLGYLNLVGKRYLELKGIWKNLDGSQEMANFKKQLQSARYEVNRELELRSHGPGKILSITSLNEGEGKSLVSACVAYTNVMVGKKVLLIDGNFEHPSITTNSNTQLFIEDYLNTGILHHVDFNSGIMVMGNRGGDKTLLEVIDEDTIRQRMADLKSKFDVILVEVPALSSLNKAKEWILFSDKTIGVFEANQTLDSVKKQHLHYLSSLNGQFIGWILNKVISPEKAYENIKAVTVIE